MRVLRTILADRKRWQRQREGQGYLMDRYRPTYHFRPEANWMNDPNGPLYYAGEYHLFYQYNPYGDKWGTIHWGHAKSRDLIHWEACPIALAPDEKCLEIHCYSGCAFLQAGLPTIYYTSVGEGNRGPMEGALQRAAISRDGMTTWERREEPALDKQLHESCGIHIAMWRDPFVWEEPDGLYALLGGTLTEQSVQSMEEVEQGRGCLALYHAPGGKDWEFKSIMLSSTEHYLLECPNMIPFGEQYLLLYSPLDAVRYAIGTLDKKTWRFRIQREGILDYSIQKCGFYAPNTYLNDPQGRKVIVGWLSEADREKLHQIRGWAGMLSVPREVWLEEGRLRLRPVEETHLLRRKTLFAGGEGRRAQPALPERPRHCEPFRCGRLASGRALEISLCIGLCSGSLGRMELALLAGADGAEETRICYTQKNGRIWIDRSRSSLPEGSVRSTVEAYLEEPFAERLRLRIFVDHSALEVFVGEQCSMTARVYPAREDSCGVYLRCAQQLAVEEITIWELAV